VKNSRTQSKQYFVIIELNENY